MDKIKIPCGKCNGKGMLPEYRHIQAGVCFACRGIGYFEYTLKQIEQKNRKAQEKAEKQLQEREQKQKEYAEKLYTFIETMKNHPVFIDCMKNCTNEKYYEQHVYNTMRYMITRGLYNE
jgi:vacuolar-type H+-ATPase subunit I/STV1